MRISDWSSDVCSSDRHRERINENSFRLAVSALLSLASLSLASSLADEGRAHWSRISLGCTPVTTPQTSPSSFPVWQPWSERALRRLPPPYRVADTGLVDVCHPPGLERALGGFRSGCGGGVQG